MSFWAQPHKTAQAIGLTCLKSKMNAMLNQPKTSVKKSRVLIVDDQPIINDGLRLILQNHPMVSDITTATDYGSSIALLRQHAFDLLITDLALQGSDEDGFQLAQQVKELFPDIRIIVFTMYVRIDLVDRLFHTLGVDAYLDKNIGVEALHEAVTKVLTGERYLQPEVAEVISKGNPYRISSREKEVLCLLAKGKTKQEIADELFLSFHTVNTHIRNLFAKFEVTTTAELVKKFTEYFLSNTEDVSTNPGFNRI